MYMKWRTSKTGVSQKNTPAYNPVDVTAKDPLKSPETPETNKVGQNNLLRPILLLTLKVTPEPKESVETKRIDRSKLLRSKSRLNNLLRSILFVSTDSFIL